MNKFLEIVILHDIICIQGGLTLQKGFNIAHLVNKAIVTSLMQISSSRFSKQSDHNSKHQIVYQIISRKIRKLVNVLRSLYYLEIALRRTLTALKQFQTFPLY